MHHTIQGASLHVNDPEAMTDGFESFRRHMGEHVQYTFNWFYVDAEDIGYQHSCKCPQRAQGVDPYLPAWGTGEWDWQGFIGIDNQPTDLNPAGGYITSWNNKQAPLFTANDRNFTYGPVYRSQLLDRRIEAAFATGEKLDRADVVEIMEEAGTVDLRGQEMLALLLEVMGETAPVDADPRAQEMRDRLATWLLVETHRRDHDRDGHYADPQAPAIIDAWWPILAHAMFDAASGNAIANLGLELEDGNRRAHLGSAFQGGFYSHVQKDLRQVLGLPVAQPWFRTYCGGGDAAACRAVLWQALSDAAAALEEEFDSPDVEDWQRQIADEDVRHVPVGVTSVEAIHWINRPTFQQVVQVGVPVPAGESFGAGSLTGAGGDKIGFVYRVQAFAGGDGEGRFQLRDASAGIRLEVREIMTARAPAGEGCGSVPAGAANTFEFWGAGIMNGSGSHAVHVCAQDNADPGGAADILHVDCGTCSYDTQSEAAGETLSAGNLKVLTAGSGDAAEGEASVLTLEPVLGLQGDVTLPVLLTATVYDRAGRPLPGIEVHLLDATGLDQLAPLEAVTDTGGRISFTADSLEALLKEWTAVASGVHSNPVRLD